MLAAAGRVVQSLLQHPAFPPPPTRPAPRPQLRAVGLRLLLHQEAAQPRPVRAARPRRRGHDCALHGRLCAPPHPDLPQAVGWRGVRRGRAGSAGQGWCASSYRQTCHKRWMDLVTCKWGGRRKAEGTGGGGGGAALSGLPNRRCGKVGSGRRAGDARPPAPAPTCPLTHTCATKRTCPNHRAGRSGTAAWLRGLSPVSARTP